MKSFKNWEKNAASNIEIFFYNLSLKIENLWKSFIKKGNEKITIMFIPHNQKKIVNLHLSLFTIVFFIIFFSILIILIFITTSSLSSYANELSLYKNKTYELSQKQEKINKLVEDAYKSFITMKSNFEKVTTIFSSKKSIVNELGQGGQEIKLDYNNVQELDQKLLSINESYKKLTLFWKEYVKRKDDLEYLYRNIPSRWPFYVRKGRITSPFGLRKDPFSGNFSFHAGIDIAYRYGAPVVATADGIVEYRGPKMGYGLVVIIKHKYGFSTYYAHLSAILVRKGQIVKKGQIIGKEGRTGRVTGAHLHYGIKINNTFVNPSDYLFYNLENF